MAYYVLVKDGYVFNAIVWDGPGENNENDLDFGEGVTYHRIEDGEGVAIGWTYVDGKFIAPPEPEIPHEQLVQQAENEKNSRIVSANSIFLLWQTKLLLNRASEEEKSLLNQWVDYVDGLRTVNTQQAPDITWPEQPPIPEGGQ